MLKPENFDIEMTEATGNTGNEFKVVCWTIGKSLVIFS